MSDDYNNDPYYNNVATIVRAAQLPPDQFMQAIAPGYGNNPAAHGGRGGGLPLDYANDPSASGQQGQPAQNENGIDEVLARLAGDRDRRRQEFWRKLKDDLDKTLSTMANMPHPSGTIPMRGDQYNLEKLDSHHRMGNLLLACLREYEEREPQLGFFEWLDGMPEFERMTLLRGQGSSRPSSDILLPSVVRAFVRGVAYLDSRTRLTYRVRVQGGKLVQNRATFDTDRLKTVWSGPGWAIYVLSKHKHLYANSHVFGEFHHSSFTSGSAVICAGEMKVSQGQLKILTAKTGHYKTPKENFVTAIRHLQEKGVHPSSYTVKVFQAGNLAQPTASEFLAHESKYTVWN
jgi:hypothetical protein